MKLKTISKINIYSKYVMDLISHILDLFAILLVFLLGTIIFSGLIKFIYVPYDGSVFGAMNYVSFISAFYIFCIGSFLMGTYFILYLFFEAVFQKILPFKISDKGKMIMSHLINKFHKKNSYSYASFSYTKLHLELIKLEKAFNNKSDVYKEISEDDFPYIHKFIRRCKRNPKLTLKQEKTIVHQGGLINTRNLDKLNLSENPKLLTLDTVDNGLNDLINSRLKILHQDKCRAENDKHSCSSYLASQLEVKLEDIG